MDSKRAKTARGRRILRQREAKVIENTRMALVVRGQKTSADVNAILTDLFMLKKPCEAPPPQSTHQNRPIPLAASLAAALLPTPSSRQPTPPRRVGERERALPSRNPAAGTPEERRACVIVCVGSVCTPIHTSPPSACPS